MPSFSGLQNKHKKQAVSSVKEMKINCTCGTAVGSKFTWNFGNLRKL
jgi:hypothetical protein